MAEAEPPADLREKAAQAVFEVVQRSAPGIDVPAVLLVDAVAGVLAEHYAAEIDRLHSWAGLIELLDEHYPADVFGASSDPGPTIIALTRQLDGLRVRVERAEKFIDAAHGLICNAHRARVDDVAEQDGASPGWAEAARRWIDAYPLTRPSVSPDPTT